MMNIEVTRTFIKLYRKLDPDLKLQVKKTLRLFQENPLRPSLYNKKIAGQSNIYEIRVSRNYRITYSKSGDLILLRKVGTHDILKKPQ
ncbi:MAG: hypothetical protein L6422_03035 [Candidatus Marinimicrobia bacterium]|nr:hypothetical protein [Candidatus Neomarinimicrobiota bacterium]